MKKTIIRYSPNALEACAKLVKLYNTSGAANMSVLDIEESIIESMNRFLSDPELVYTGTLGYLVVAFDREEEENANYIDVEFVLEARLYADATGITHFPDIREHHLTN